MGIIFNGFTAANLVNQNVYISKGDFLMDNNQSLEETKRLNQQSKQGNMSAGNMTSGANDPALEEARQLNQQSRQSSTSGSSMSSNAGAGMTSGVGNSDLEEAKQLNQQSRQNKR